MQSEAEITYADILRVLASIKAAGQFDQIYLKFGDIEIDLARGPGQSLPASNHAAPIPSSPPPARPQPAPPAPEAACATAAPRPAEPSWPADAILIRAPMVGTFYRRPSPDAAPFVEIGQTVEAGATLCIVEVMKLMNSINASARGTISHIVAENAELVEPGQILMVMDPR
jgi:acetyl-CoA carboxylase biotin carboxyl carrier protein